LTGRVKDRIFCSVLVETLGIRQKEKMNGAICKSGCKNTESGKHRDMEDVMKV
jgi:hypothetical protein